MGLFGSKTTATEEGAAEAQPVEIVPDDKNANKGTKRGLELLEKSLEKFGAGRSILVDKNGRVIAGNKTIQAAIEKGFDVQVVKSDGKRVIAVMREDIDLDTPEGRELAIADNRVAEMDLDWDGDVLRELSEEGIDFSDFFFNNEFSELTGIETTEDDAPDGDKKERTNTPPGPTRTVEITAPAVFVDSIGDVLAAWREIDGVEVSIS